MNGLRYIRTQCNISLSGLADALGVSRQIVSAWETGKKEIPPRRKQELSAYFGLSPEYFEEMNEAKKESLSKKAMFRVGSGEEEHYLYHADHPEGTAAGSEIIFALKERSNLLSEEYRQKKKAQKDLISAIDRQISGPSKCRLTDQMLYLNRGLYYYGACRENMDAAFSKPVLEKMVYYSVLTEVTAAVSEAFQDSCPAERDFGSGFCGEDAVFIERLAKEIRAHLEARLEDARPKQSVNSARENREANKERKEDMKHMTMAEAVAYAEKELEQENLPADATGFHLYFPDD